jgi:hypothetical protein
VTNPKAGLVRRKKLVKEKIGNKLLVNKTFHAIAKRRQIRKVKDWAIYEARSEDSKLGFLDTG